METKSRIDWSNLSEEALLETRVRDLGLRVAGSELQSCVEQLYRELDQKNIQYHPPVYLADEWFVLEGSSAIGIPFYLAHPRLKALEQKMMLEVEGGSAADCIRLLRHEAGHALFYAYRLNKRKEVRKAFGPSPAEPPETYRPKPYSKSFVRHLDNWYAQAEPDEDFAETFAIWLTPDLDWKKHYAGWPALEKLKLMDRLMTEVSAAPPPNLSVEKAFAADRLRAKLKTYYQRKQKLYAEDYPSFYDRDLFKVFSHEGGGEGAEPAFRFMKRHRRVVIDKVAHWSGEKKFIVNNLYKKLMERSRDLNLKVQKSEAETLLEITAFLTSMAANYLFTGKFKPTV